MGETDPASKTRRPNIVIILADDLGFSDVGCYGGEIRTPNIDGLANDGMRFTQFYNNAVCMPTRASLLTGLYPHQVGSSGKATLNDRNNVTLAEALRGEGYRTMLAGKWHNGSSPRELPTSRGFDRYWGLLSGCSNYFNPGLQRAGEPEPVHKRPADMRPWGDGDRVIHPFTPDDPNFYTTDAITDKALHFLHECQPGQPFFLYLAHCAPHFPMQARREDIDRYRGSYACGWEEVRHRRWERLRASGIADDGWSMSERDETVPPWDSVDDPDVWDLRMSIYAAMVDRMDAGIGRVLLKLREMGADENTVVFFLSDNGGCSQHIDRTPPGVIPGGVDSYCTVNAPWANASNTPFRKYKIFTYEGGICTPLIVRWPAMIRGGGQISGQVGHVTDFFPTLLEIAKASYPDQFEERELLPLEGQSFAGTLRGGQNAERKPVFWEVHGCRAARIGKWKIVQQGPPRSLAGITFPAGRDRWELYDLEADRCETKNLAMSNPGLVSELAAAWEQWHARCHDAGN